MSAFVVPRAPVQSDTKVIRKEEALDRLKEKLRASDPQ
jgi:hypothetical protein